MSGCLFIPRWVTVAPESFTGENNYNSLDQLTTIYETKTENKNLLEVRNRKIKWVINWKKKQNGGSFGRGNSWFFRRMKGVSPIFRFHLRCRVTFEEKRASDKHLWIEKRRFRKKTRRIINGKCCARCCCFIPFPAKTNIAGWLKEKKKKEVGGDKLDSCSWVANWFWLWKLTGRWMDERRKKKKKKYQKKLEKRRCWRIGEG